MAVLHIFLAGVCACMNFALPLTLLISMNALFTDWLTTFDASRAQTTAVQATCMGVTLGAGVVAGVLERKLGERMSMMLGSFLAAVGLFSGSFAPSLPVLIFCVGVLTGSGFCLLHLSSLSTALRRFPERAPFMSSMMTVVGGLLHLVTPIMYRYLSELYTWRGTLLVASGIILHTAIFALLLTSPLCRPHPHPPSIASGSRDTSGTCKPHGDGTIIGTCPAKLHESDFKETGPDTDGMEDKLLWESRLGCLETSQNADPIEDVWDKGLQHNGASVVGDVQTECYKRHILQTETDIIADSDDCDVQRTCFKPQTLSLDVVSSSSHYLQERANTSRLSDSSIDEHVLPSSHLFQPCDKQKDESLAMRNNNACEEEEPASSMIPHKSTEEEEEKEKSCMDILREDASFLRSPVYLCVLLSTVMSLSTIVCFVFLVLDFADNKGWTVEEGVFLNFVYMLCGLIGRVLVGLVSLHSRVRSTPLLIGSGLVGSVAVCCVGQVEKLSVAAALYGCMGAMYGVVVGMFPPAVLDATGPKTYPVALGLICTVEGIVDVAAGVFTGVLVDLLQSYSLLSLVYGFISLATSVLLLVVYLCHTYR